MKIDLESEDYDSNNKAYHKLTSNALWYLENKGNFVFFSKGFLIGEGLNKEKLLDLIQQQRNPDNCYIAKVGTDSDLTRVSSLKNLDLSLSL